MKIVKITLVLCLLLVTQDCNALKGQSDMENIIWLMEQNDPDEFKAVMHQFVESARADDLEQMVSLTSTVTIEKVGLESLKKLYLNDSIPALKACTISDSGEVIAVSAAESGTGPGWVFRTTCFHGEDESVPIQFVVLKEDGRIVLTSFGLG